MNLAAKVRQNVPRQIDPSVLIVQVRELLQGGGCVALEMSSVKEVNELSAFLWSVVHVDT